MAMLDAPEGSPNPSPRRRHRGCRRPLADGQWWRFCGETDMGQTMPVLCTECGGDMRLKEAPND